MFKKVTTAAAVALVGLGAGAASASAYSISGGSYTATSSSDHSFTLGGAYTHNCSNVTLEGEATGAATTMFTPVIGECNFYGFPVSGESSGPWSMTVESGPVGGVYTASLSIPSGTTATFINPLWGYSLSIAGPQTFPNAASVHNGPGGAQLSFEFSGASYVMANGPVSSGSDLVYTTNGGMLLSGVTVGK